MKKFFIFIATMLATTTMSAQHTEGVLELSKATYDAETTAAKGGQDWYFTGTEVYLNMNGRAWKDAPRQEWDNGLNFKNNTNYTIQLGTVKAYRIEFAGYSLGDNWDYLYAYGPVAEQWEWIDPIGMGVKDNQTIIDKAVYPLDPCESTSGAPTMHKAGYTWASIDFTEMPYEGTFAFKFSGNNQEQTLIRIYTTKESAQNPLTAIKGVQTTAKVNDGATFNLAGQRVGKNYKGVVVKNGRKFVQK